MIAERLPVLPPFRWRLKQVPLGLDYPSWIDDPDFDLEYHVRDVALAPPPSDAKLAEQVARIFARPLDRARPLWGALPDPRAAGRQRGAADQDQSCGGRPAVFARAAQVTFSLAASRTPVWNLVVSNVPGPQFPLY